MLKTDEALYYYMQGLDTLEIEDVEDIKRTLKDIKDTGDKDRYELAQELYEIYLVVLNKGIMLILNVDRTELGGFLGNLSLANEWNNFLVKENDTQIYKEFTGLMYKLMDETISEEEYVGEFAKLQKRFKEFTGRDVVVPMDRYYEISKSIYPYIEGDYTWEIDYLELLGEGRTGEEVYGKDYWSRLTNYSERMPESKYTKGVIRESQEKLYFTLGELFEHFEKGNLEGDVAIHIDNITKGLFFNVRLIQLMTLER